MEAVEVFQLVPIAGEQIVVCQCHRSCQYVEVASLCGVLPQVQFLDKAVDMPVASNDRCLGLSVQKNCGHPQLQCCDIVVDVLVCAGRRLGLLVEVPQIQFIASSSWTFQCAQRQGAFSEGLVAMWGWVFFALLRVVPELSASFRSPR